MTIPATQRGSLKFELKFHSVELNNLTLPIEIRKGNMSLVKRALSSETVEVEPGSYYVTTTLPAGQEIVSQVDVDAGEEKSVDLKPDLEDESPHENQELQHFLKGALTSDVAPAPAPRGAENFGLLETLGGGGDSSTQAKLRLFSVNLLKGWLQDISFLLTAPANPAQKVAQITLNAGDQPRLVQLLQSNKPPINMMVPTWPAKSAMVVLVRLPDDSYSLDMHLQHQIADLLCHYSAQNLFEQVALTANSSTLDAEQLLKAKMQDPIAAAVGAYALLRIGAVERLHDWTENLKNWFPGLPDGLTVRGEHLARNGEHEQALDLFLELPTRGLPIFSDGLMYALDRLQSYVSLGATEFGEDKIAKADKLVNRLQEFATYVDFGKPILTYTGLDPLNPDLNPLSELPPEGGKDVSSFVS